MDLKEAIEERHSIRKYISKPLATDIVTTIKEKVDEVNAEGNLHIQFITNETKAFTGLLSYGSFYGVENYFALVGKESESLDERTGYYGEKLVLFVQMLGLNTCWVGLTYRKVTDAYAVASDEKLVCLISVGYGNETGKNIKHKTAKQVSNVSDSTPEWFIQGVEAALKAPTAVNQQKFSFTYVAAEGKEKAKVIAKPGFSLVGYTKIDLGIAKLHFEIGAGKENFDWAE